MFDLFYRIEVYSCKVLYSSPNESPASVRPKLTFQHTSQCTTESFTYSLYNVTHHVMKSKTLLLSLLHSMQELCYNLWNLLSMWLFLLTNMMNSTDNSSSSMSTTNFNICVNFTDNNSCNYFSFNMSLVFSYMNSQLIYYFIFDAISAAEQAWF